MRRALLTICSLCVLVSGLTVGASAADYSFDTKPETGYYKATNYEDKYNAAYHYKGQNQIDTDIPEIRYGLSSSMGGFLEGSVSGANGNSDSFGLTGTTSSSYPNLDYGTGTRTTNDPIYVPFATDVTMSQLKKSDGSYGTVAISRAGLSAKVYEGATTESMAKGAGHYVDTAAWNGNIGLFGHNRGSNAYFAALKNVKLSDTVTYTNQYMRALTELYDEGVRRIILAFDSDAEFNPHVAQALKNAEQLGIEHGFDVYPLCWDPHFKGIDDLMLSFKEY